MSRDEDSKRPIDISISDKNAPNSNSEPDGAGQCRIHHYELEVRFYPGTLQSSQALARIILVPSFANDSLPHLPKDMGTTLGHNYRPRTNSSLIRAIRSGEAKMS